MSTSEHIVSESEQRHRSRDQRKKLKVIRGGLVMATLTMAVSFGSSGSARAQVAGSTTTIGVSVVEATRVAQGWSVKKTLLGKAVYNDAGEQIGKVEDLIIAPDRNVSYVIIGAGGFIGIGRHDVAIPVAQVQDKAGRLVIPGATKRMVKSMPRFDYANDTARRDEFIASARQDIARAKTKLTELRKSAGSAANDVKASIDQQAAGLQKDVNSAEEKVAEMNRAAADRWREFEDGVSAATLRLRKAVDPSAV